MTVATVDVPPLSDAARAAIDTPALVVDLDRMEAAIARMAGAMADRLRALATRTRLRVGFDSETGVRAIADALGPECDRVGVVIEVDSGGRRSGVELDRVGVIARAAADAGLAVKGVFTYAGHAYLDSYAHVEAGNDEVRTLTDAASALRALGIEPEVVSAGSTPTAIDSAHGVVTEERPGTYVYGDRQQVALGSIARDAPAGFVATRVTSVNATERRFVVDAGGKMFGKDMADYMTGYSEIPELDGAIVVRLSDYHGTADVPAGSRLPEVGQVVLAVPNHICPVVDHVASFLVVRDGEIVDTWPVDARGRNG